MNTINTYEKILRLETLLTEIQEEVSNFKAELKRLEYIPQNSIDESITSTKLKSFIDGKWYRTLKKHLKKNGLTPEMYRVKYNLPEDYPMVAKELSEKRKQIVQKSHETLRTLRKNKKESIEYSKNTQYSNWLSRFFGG